MTKTLYSQLADAMYLTAMDEWAYAPAKYGEDVFDTILDGNSKLAMEFYDGKYYEGYQEVRSDVLHRAFYRRDWSVRPITGRAAYLEGWDIDYDTLVKTFEEKYGDLEEFLYEISETIKNEEEVA